MIYQIQLYICTQITTNKSIIMKISTEEIYKIASGLTEQESHNIIAGWEKDTEKEQLDLVNSLIRLGDTLQMAVATTIAEKYNNL